MFLDLLLGSVLGQLCEKMEYEKRVEKKVEKESTGWKKRAQAGRFAAEAGPGGGRGRLRLRTLQEFALSFSTPCYL